MVFQIPYNVSDILNIPVLKDAQVLSGEKGLSKIVKGITVIEAPDIANWISGGEVLLTSLYAFRTASEPELEVYMNQFASRDVCAIIIKTGRFFENVPEIMVRMSEKLSIPIIKTNKDVAFRDILYPVMENLFNEEIVRLKYFKETYDHFIALALTGEGVSQIVDSLEKLIGNPIALFGGDGVCLHSTNSNFAALHPVKSENTVTPQIITKNVYYKQMLEDDTHVEQIIVQMEISYYKYYLVITECDRKIESLDYIAIENASVCISIETMKQLSVTEQEKKYKNYLIDDLLAGNIRSLSTIYRRADLLGLLLDKPYYVICFNIESANPENQIQSLADSFAPHNIQYQILERNISRHLMDSIIQNRGDSMIALTPAKGEGSAEEIEVLKGAADKIIAAMHHYNTDLRIMAGIGNIAAALPEIARSCKEAQDSLHFSKIVGGGSNVTAFSDLGIFRLLNRLETPAQLYDFVPDKLKKLLNHKQPIKEDLIITLKAFIKNNQNVTKTSQDLFVHYKTVIYRIERIKEITGIDLNDSDELFSTQLGLKILGFLDSGG